MSVMSRFLAWQYNLPPAETYAVMHARDLPVPMPDGTVQLVDHYYPAGGSNPPTVLIRSPYGRRTTTSNAVARLFAERGLPGVDSELSRYLRLQWEIFPLQG